MDEVKASVPGPGIHPGNILPRRNSPLAIYAKIAARLQKPPRQTKKGGRNRGHPREQTPLIRRSPS